MFGSVLASASRSTIDAVNPFQKLPPWGSNVQARPAKSPPRGYSFELDVASWIINSKSGEWLLQQPKGSRMVKADVEENKVGCCVVVVVVIVVVVVFDFVVHYEKLMAPS